MIEWYYTPLSTVFQSYHGDSSHYSFLSWVSPVLGWGSEVSCPRTLPQKTLRIQCGSNPGPQDYESNTLPLSHAGPLQGYRMKHLRPQPGSLTCSAQSTVTKDLSLKSERLLVIFLLANRGFESRSCSDTKHCVHERGVSLPLVEGGGGGRGFGGLPQENS